MFKSRIINSLVNRVSGAILDFRLSFLFGFFYLGKGGIMQKEKLEQLRKIFEEILNKYIGNSYYDFTIDDLTNELIYEVKIRIKED